MGETTTISWTEKTYDPWIGCQQVTEAECGDCYAKRWAQRQHLDVWGSLSGSTRHLTKTHTDPRRWNHEAQALGRRVKVFCASLADVFEPHPQVAQARTRLWALIEDTPFLDWQLLTKRPKFICGGYSGTQHRPMQLSWARRVRDECQHAHCAFFMKQLGSVYAREQRLHDWKGEDLTEFPPDLRLREFPSLPLRNGAAKLRKEASDENAL